MNSHNVSLPNSKTSLIGLFSSTFQTKQHKTPSNPSQSCARVSQRRRPLVNKSEMISMALRNNYHLLVGQGEKEKLVTMFSLLSPVTKPPSPCHA